MATSAHIGAAIKKKRRTLKMKQAELAAAAGVGLRFIVELEAGKATAQLAKVLTVLESLGLDFVIVDRSTPTLSRGSS